MAAVKTFCGLFLTPIIFSLWTIAYATPLIHSIDFKNDLGGSLRVNTASMSLQVGGVFNSELLIKDVNLLKNSMPQFHNIQAQINPMEGPALNTDMVKIIFEFQIKRTIKTLNIVTAGQVKNIKLADNIREKLLLQRGAVFDAAKLEADKKKLTLLLVEQGYAKAVVSHKLDIADSHADEVILNYIIDPVTPQLKIRQVYFAGNSSFDARELQKIIPEKGVFNAEELDFTVKELTKYYQDSGFFEANISSSFSTAVNGDTSIHIQIQEGRRYRVRGIRYLYGKPYKEHHAEIKGAYPLVDLVYYNDKSIREAMQALREYFGSKGHAKVQVLASYDSDDEVVTVRIIEGAKYRIRQVRIEGNEKMQARRIMLDVDIKTGDLFDAKKVKSTLEKLNKTGFYSDVQMDFNPTNETKGKEAGEVVIVVKEARTRTITFGAGAGTSGILGEIGIGDSNIFGSGKTVSLHFQRTLEMTKIGMLYRDPHLFESDYAFSANANYKNDNRSEFNEERIGAVLMIEKQITNNLKLGVGTRIEFLNLSEIDEQIRLADPHADGEDRIIGMIGTLYYKKQTKDTAGDIKDGIKVKMALLPSSADQGMYIKTFATVMGTKSLWENQRGVAHTISGRLTVGYASENTPFFEKFYAGGNATLRGFRRGSVKTTDGDGGQVLVSGNVSYSFPVWRETVKGVVFLEAASVGDSFDDLGNIRSVGGMGIRANLADTFLGGMIEAGFAIPLKKEDSDDLRPFYFVFGDYDPAYDL